MLQGRFDEFTKLNDLYARSESNLVVLYGDHLSGISSLWQDFAKEKDAFCLSCVPASDKEQAYLWLNSLNGLPENKNEISYFDVFSFLSSNANPDKEKNCIIISDFHYAVNPGSLFLQDLNRFLQVGSLAGHTTFVLVSERTDWIENDFAPAVKDEGIRIAGYVKVNPLHFIDLVCSVNTRDFDSLLSYYSLFGGYYDTYSFIDTNETLKENIIRNFLKPFSPFRNYGMDMIRRELREPAVYATILSSLAQGKNKLNDLFLHTGFSRAKISVYLKNLNALGLVEKVRSYDTPGSENTKKGVYRIINPMVKFYFTFLYPYESYFFTLDESSFYDCFIANRIGTYCMNSFPSICEEFLVLANDRDMLPIHFIRYGQWVGKTGIVDLITQDQERNFLFAFCNPTKEVLSLDAFLKQLATTKETHLTPDYFAVFSLDGFDDAFLEEFSDKENVLLFDRTDLC